MVDWIGLRGDDNSLFILDAFAFYRSVPGGPDAVHAIWPALQRAAEWNFRQAAQHGTIQSRTLINTFGKQPHSQGKCTGFGRYVNDATAAIVGDLK